MAVDTSSALFAPTGNDNIAPTPFYVLNWVFFVLCVVAFVMRAYVRYVCFRRLVLEDYLMLAALALHCAEAVLVQLYVGYMYDVEAVEKGDFSVMGPDFFGNSKKGFAALGASVNITIVGVLIIKLNFLIFFKRLGAGIRKFNIAWWAVTFFTVASAITQIGMQTFGCFFGSTDYIFSEHCAAEPALTRIFANAIYSAVVDAVSDVLIMCFPVWILWGSGITLRKKLALTFVFSLVWLTIAITIVRGSIFHKQYSMAASGEGSQMQSATFTWFWFYTEFSVAFLIACFVSFRSLFVQRSKQASSLRQQQELRDKAYQSALRRRGDRSWRARWHYLHESLLDKCRTLEGWTGSDDETLRSHGWLPSVPSGLMTVDFQDDDNWTRKRNFNNTAKSTDKNNHDHNHNNNNNNNNKTDDNNGKAAQDKIIKTVTTTMTTTTMSTVREEEEGVIAVESPYDPYQQNPPRYDLEQQQQQQQQQRYTRYGLYPQHQQYSYPLQHPQYYAQQHPPPPPPQQQQQYTTDARPGSLHSEEMLLQEPEPAHVRTGGQGPVGMAR
ncbi:uncharacterized protein P884DRAFT_260554 [Thermothelomyces heterothallicus CBS 202.75]|uniref:uncharacterized protein n=1 Tax=Thermothelomyces heterothallicus CBS 202.75 TaxID=1149848 RepID=UPI0037434BFA